MKIRNVRDLKKYLAETEQSPEDLAVDIGLSHMTIRRLLKRPSQHPIQLKYWPLFDRVGGGVTQIGSTPVQIDGFVHLMKQVEKEGASCKTPEETRSSALKKAKQKGIGQEIISLVRTLDHALRKGTSYKAKAVALGALLYFLNPMDMIPDAIPVFGYLDDFAVLTLAVTALATMDIKDSTQKA